jgi:hypothetical protein
MITSPIDPEIRRNHFAMLKPLIGAELAGASEEIATVAGFELSEAAAQPFVEFVRWINTRPRFIAEWRADPEAEARDYIRFMTVAGDARSAYAGMCYHLRHLKQIEADVNAVLSRYDFAKVVPPASVAAFGQMHQLDFEYQAFVLAYRRCLDYLSWGISTYFKVKQNSYSKLKKTLDAAHPASVAQAVLAVYDRHRPRFDFVMGTARGQSVRDRISHFEFVQAGTINVGLFGHRVVGGGERLHLANPDDGQSLSEILEQRAADLHACITNLLETFRNAVIQHETNPG